MKKYLRCATTFVFFLFICVLLNQGYGQNTYVGPLSGSWNTNSNWSSGLAPTSTDNVVIPAGRTVNFDILTATVNSLQIGSGATLHLGTSAGTVTFTINTFCDLSASGTLDFGTNGSHTVTILDDLIGSNGTIIMNSSTTHVLNLGGDNNELSNFNCATIGTVFYNRVGDQSMFISPNYKTVQTSNSGIKSLAGSGTTCAINVLNVGTNTTFSMGVNPTPPVLSVAGNVTIGASATFSFGSVSAKSVTISGNTTMTAANSTINMTGFGLAHTLKFMGTTVVGASTVITTTPGSKSTIIYAGGVHNIVNATYQNVIVEGAAAKTLVFGTPSTFQGKLTITKGATLSLGAVAGTYTCDSLEINNITAVSALSMAASTAKVLRVLSHFNMTTGTTLTMSTLATHKLELQGLNNTCLGAITQTAGNTIEYSGTGAQNMLNTTYQNLLLTGSSGQNRLVQGNITVNGNLTNNSCTLVFGNTARTVTVLGDLLGNISSAIDMRLVAGHMLDLKGPNNTCGSLITDASLSTVRYSGGVQTVFGSNSYRRLEVNGASNKSLTNNVFVHNQILFSGNAKIILGTFDLTLSEVGTFGGSPFSNAKMIETNGLNTPAGSFIKQGTAAPAFNMTYPLGTNFVYTPVTISGITGTIGGMASVAMKPVDNTASCNSGNCSKKYLLVSTSNYTITQVNFNFQLPAAEIVGTPSQVKRNANTVNGQTIDLGLASYGANGSNTFDGLWQLLSSGTKYFSVADGSWEDGSIWSTIGFGAAACGCTPSSFTDIVRVGDGKRVIKSTPSPVSVDSIHIDATGVLELGQNASYVTANVLSNKGIGGNGVLSISDVAGIVSWPNILTLDFITAAGTGNSTVEYLGLGNFMLPSLPNIYRNLSIKGGFTATSQSNYSVTGNLRVLAGSTLDLQNFSMDHSMPAGDIIEIATTSSLIIGGTNTFPANYTTRTIASNSTVEYNGGNQNVAALTYAHLKCSVAGTKSLVGITTINGLLTIGSGATLEAGAFNCNAYGNALIQGIFDDNNGGGINYFGGTISVTSSGRFLSNSISQFDFFDDIINDGIFQLNSSGAPVNFYNTNTFTANSNVLMNATLNITGAWTLAGSATYTISDVFILPTGQVDNQSTAIVSNSMDGSGPSSNWTQLANSVLHYRGATHPFSSFGYLSASFPPNVVYFDGTLNQDVNGVVGQTFHHLVLGGTNDKRLMNNFFVNGDVTIEAGANLNRNNFNISLQGNWIQHGGAFGSGDLAFINAGADQIVGGTSSNAIFGSVTINKTSGRFVRFNIPSTITGGLNYTGNGDIELSNFTVGVSTITGGSPTRRVLTNGTGMLSFSAGLLGSYTIHLGTGPSATADYTPITIALTSASFGAIPEISVRSVPSVDPNVISASTALTRHFIINSFDITNITSAITFTYADGDVQGTESNYVSAFWNTSWVTGNTAAVDESTNQTTINKSAATNFNGSYTAGELLSFSASKFYSRQNGDWNLLSTWTNDTLVGNPVTVLPTNSNSAMIRNGHTVTLPASPCQADSLIINFGGILSMGNNGNQLSVNVFSNNGHNGNGKVVVTNANFPTIGVNDFLNAQGTGNSTWEFAGVNFVVPFSYPANFRNVIFSASTDVTLQRNLTIAGDVSLVTNLARLLMGVFTIDRASLGGKFEMLAGAELWYNGNNFPSNYATYILAPTSWVFLDGEAPQIIKGNINYGNIGLTSQPSLQTKTIDGDIMLAGQLSLGNNTVFSFGNAAARNVTIDGAFFTGSGTVDMSGAGLAHNLYLAGTVYTPSSFITTDGSGSTVHYSSGATQTVFPALNYQNLNLMNSGSKMVNGNTIVRGNVNCMGSTTLQLGNSVSTFTVAGNMNMASTTTLVYSTSTAQTVAVSGNYAGTGSTINMSGTGLAHRLELTGATNDFGSLTTTGGSGSTVHYNSAAAQSLPNGISYQVLEVSGGTKNYSTTGTMVVSGALRLNGAVINLATSGSINLVLGATLTNSVAFSTTNMVATNGTGVFTRGINAAAAYFYPIGTTGAYAPLNLNVTAVTGAGTVSARTVATVAPNQISATNSLTRYWAISGAAITSISGTFTYSYNEGEVMGGAGNDVTYIAAHWPNSFPWVKGTLTDVDEVANSISFTKSGANIASFSGNYTAGPLNAFGTPVYYSRVAAGNFETAASWSTDPVLQHTGAPALTPPAAGSVVRIANGHTITRITSTALTLDTLYINAGGRLNMAATTGLTVNVFSNQGIGGNGTIAFSAGNFITIPIPANNLFCSGAGTGLGTVEYSGVSYNLPAALSTLPNLSLVSAGTVTRTFLGNCTILGNLVSGLNITVNLGTVGTVFSVGGNVSVTTTFNFGTTVAKTLSVVGDFSAPTLTMTGAGLAHQLTLAGANNGVTTLTTTAASGSRITYARVGAQNAFASANYQNVSIDATANVLWPATAATTLASNLILNGMLNIGGASANGFTVNGTTAFGPSSTLTFSASVVRQMTLSGTITSAPGAAINNPMANPHVINITAASVQLPPIINMVGGNLNISGGAGQIISYLAGTNHTLSNFTLTGAGVKMMVAGGTNPTIATNTMNINTATLDLNDLPLITINGNLNINSLGILRYGSTAAPNSIIVNGDLSGVAGSKIEMQLANNGSLLTLNGTTNTLGSLSINPGNNTIVRYGAMANQNLLTGVTEYNFLEIAGSGQKNVVETTLTVYRSLNLSGTTTFNLSNISVTANIHQSVNAVPTANFEFGTSFPKTVNILSTTLTSTFGTINMTGAGLSHTLRLACPSVTLVNFNTTPGANSTVEYNGTVPQQIFTSANYQILRISGGTEKSLSGLCAVNNALDLVSGIVDLSGFDLVLGAGTILTGSPFNATNMIRTSGAGRLQIGYSTPVNKIFPVGTGSHYSPASVNVTALSGTGSVSLQAVAGTHPQVLQPSTALLKYWDVTASGFSSLTANIEFTYVDPSELQVVETSYTHGGQYTGALPWITNGTVNTTTNVVTFNARSLSNLGGFYTAGPLSTFSLSSYYSVADGNWESGTTWSTTGYSTPNCGCVPGPGAKVYIGDNRIVTKSNATAFTLDSLTIDATGTLDLGTSGASLTISVLTNKGIGGNGRLKLGGNITPSLPAITTNDFLNSVGTGASTLEFYATADYNAPSLPANIQHLIFSGTNKITLTNGATVRGDLTVTGKLDINTSMLNQPVCCANTFTLGAGAELHTNESGLIAIPFNFLTYAFDPTSTVFYYSIVNQNIYGGGSVTYGNLVLSGNSEKRGSGDVVTVGNVDVLGTTEFNMDASGATYNSIGGNLNMQAGASMNFSTAGETVNIDGNLIAPAGIINMGTASTSLLILNGATNQAGSLFTSVAGQIVRYAGTVPQTVFPSLNYRTLELDGGTAKTLQGSVNIGESVSFLGNATLVLGTFDLILNAPAMISGSPFSASRTIVFDALLGGGKIVQKGTASVDFLKVYPMGTPGGYSELSFSLLNSAAFGVGTLSIEPYDTTGANVAHTNLRLIPNFVSNAASFSLKTAMTGTPTAVTKNGVATTNPYLIVPNEYGITATSGIQNINGVWRCLVPPAQRFYSIADGSWEIGTTWSQLGFAGTTCNCTPTPGSAVYIGNGRTVSKVNATLVSVDTIRIDDTGVLDVGTSGGSIAANVLSNIGLGGNGTLRLGGNITPTFPTVAVNDFLNAPGTGPSTLEYYATIPYTTPLPATVQSLAFSGSSKITISNSATVNQDLTITGKLDIATFNVSRTIGGGTFTLGPGAELHTGLTVPISIPNFYSNPYTVDPTSTVYYYSNSNQSVFGGANITYGNLVLSGSGTKTASGAVTTVGNVFVQGAGTVVMTSLSSGIFVGGNLTIDNGCTLRFTSSFFSQVRVDGDLNAISGTIDFGTFAGVNGARLTLNGANNQLGTHVSTIANQKVIYSGAAVQQVFGSTNYQTLELAAGPDKFLQSSITVKSAISFTGDTKLILGANNLLLSSATAITGGPFSASRMIMVDAIPGGGQVQQEGTIAAHFIKTYPVGTPSGFSELTITQIGSTAFGAGRLNIEPYDTTGTNLALMNLILQTNFATNLAEFTYTVPMNGTPTNVFKNGQSVANPVMNVPNFYGINTSSGIQQIAGTWRFLQLNTVEPAGVTPLPPFCAGQGFDMSYTIGGIFNAGNIFTLQLSDATGSFAVPVALKSINSTTAGNFLANIPEGTPSGNAYKVRIVASNPYVEGTPISGGFTINPQPVFVAQPPASVSGCESAALIAVPVTAPTATVFQWRFNGVNVSDGPVVNGTTTNTLTLSSPTPALSYSGTYDVIATTSAGCVDTSAAAAVTINSIPIAPTATIVAQPTCALPSGSIDIIAPLGAVEYAMDGGAYQPSVNFTAVAPGNHSFTARLVADITCVSPASVSYTINPAPTVPATPTATITAQPTCALPSGSIDITAPLGAFEYAMDGGTYQPSINFTAVAPGNHSFTARLIADITCVSPASVNYTINPTPLVPVAPTVNTVTQATC
nr:hypothetical protein [Cytophagaceae bacterium]